MKRQLIVICVIVLVIGLFPLGQSGAFQGGGGCPPSTWLEPATPINISNDPFRKQREVAISVDPTNPAKQVIAFMQNDPSPPAGEDRVSIISKYTTDGGKTWDATRIPEPDDHVDSIVWSDPSVAHDHQGRVYVAYNLREGARNVTGNKDAVAVARSTDGGASYTTFLATDWADQDEDKPFLEVDDNPQSPGAGYVYVAWSDLSWGGRQGLYVAKSRDRGETWIQQEIAETPGTHMVDLAVGPEGEVYAAWNEPDQDKIKFRNCGVEALILGEPRDVKTGLSNINGLSLTALGNNDLKEVVSIDVDRSVGPNRGRIWVAFINYVGGDANVNTMDVFASWSDNNGVSWAEPVKVNQDGTNTAQFMPWLDVDDVDGSVGVIYYSAQDDPANADVHVYYAHSNGGSWTNKRVTTVASSKPSGEQYKHYIGLHEQANTAYLAWTSFATGEAEVFYTKVPGITRLGDSGPSTEAVSDIEAVSLGNNYVVTAVRNSGGNLRLVSWTALSDGTITRRDEKVATSLTQPAVVLPVIEIAMDFLNGSRVVTAIRDSQDRVRLITWGVGLTGTLIQQGISALNGAPTGSQVSVRRLTGSRVLTAIRSASTGVVKLTTWDLNADNSWSQVAQSSGSEQVDTISLTSYATNNPFDGSTPTFRALTAVRDTAGNLKVNAWNVSTIGTITRRGTSPNEADWGDEVVIHYGSLGLGRAATAGKDGCGNLKLITWSISDDGQTITRLFESGTQAGAASEIRLSGWMGTGLLTAVRTGGEILRLIAWELSPDGRMQRVNDSGSLAGGVTLVALCQQPDNRYVTAVSTTAGNLKLISWRVG